jgi:anaerobic dimethyl sulfoxide reductase subunit C (anchor subunit)
MEIQWTLVLYSLLMGLSIGPFLLLALTDACENREALCKVAALVGLGCIVLAGLFAFAHLRKPLNAIYMFSNFRSPMTQETVAVLITGLIAALLATMLLFGWLPGLSRRMLAWAGLVMSLISVFMIASIYLLPARPAWNTWLLPVTLLFSSLANGLLLAWTLAVLVQKGRGETGREQLVSKLRSWALPVLVVYAVLAVVFILITVGKAGGLARLTTGDLALLFWVGLVVIGLIAPAVLVWPAKKDDRVIALTAFVLFAAGGLFIRAMLFPLGLRIPLESLW